MTIDPNADGKLGDAMYPTGKPATSDITGAMPPADLWGLPMTTVVTSSLQENKLTFAGAEARALGINDDIALQYSFGDVNVTQSGHVVEINDTPAGERILIKHRTGAGVDLLPDGSVAISSMGRNVVTVAKDRVVIVHGDASYKFKGNVDFDVDGEFNVSCLNYNVNVKQNKTVSVGNAYRMTTEGNMGVTVKGNLSETTLENKTTTTLGNSVNAIKGTNQLFSEGAMTIAGGDAIKLSAETLLDASANNVNVAGNSTSIVGASGTFGGDNVVFYGKGGTFKEGVTAPTFHGDLDGTADKATIADVTNSQNYADPDPGGGVGAAVGYTVNNVTTPTTALPDGSLMTEYLTVSDKGIIEVKVDPGDGIKNMLNRSVATGGLSTKSMTTSEVRTKMRDPANRNNQTFVAGQVAEGTLNADHIQQVPQAIGRTSSKTTTLQAGVVFLGPNPRAETSGLYVPAKIAVNRRFLPDLQYVIKS